VKKRTPALALGIFALAGAALAAPEFDLARDDDRQRLATIEKDAAKGDEAAVYGLDDVFAKIARAQPEREAKNSPGNTLIEPDPPARPDATPGVTLRSLRALAFDVAKKLPPELRKKLAAAQKEAAATERRRGQDDDEHLLHRFPFAPEAAEAAWRFAGRAFEAGDDTAALSWDRLATKLAAFQLQPPAAPFAAYLRRVAALARAGDFEAAEAVIHKAEAEPGARPVLVALMKERVEHARLQRNALEARRPPDGLIPDLMASYQFNVDDPTPPSIVGAPVAAHVSELVFASDGSRLLAVDARTGDLKGRLPMNVPKVAPPSTGLAGTVCALGDLVVGPIFYESILSRPIGKDARTGKRGDGDEDPSVRGGFFSLFVLDARTLKTIWWDGDGSDLGGRSRAPGLETLDDRAWKRRLESHVIGRPAIDGRRIYVPLLTTASESQLSIAAYERRTGEQGSLVLVPVWSTFVSLTAQALGNQVQNTTFPSVNPRLAVDPEGRVIVTTDQGVTACLDALTGNLEWVHRGTDDDNQRAAKARDRAYRTTSDAPLVFCGDGTRPSVVVVPSLDDECWLGLSCEDGSVLWRSEAWTAPRSGGFALRGEEAPRACALSPTVALGYGGQTFVAFDPWTGLQLVEPVRVRTQKLEERERPIGAAAPAGTSALLLPMNTSFVRKLVWHEERSANGRRIELSFGEPLTLTGTQQHQPFHLMALEGRLVATTPTRLLVYSWVARGD
jgi:outer membrane protein assembly factor BamB